MMQEHGFSFYFIHIWTKKKEVFVFVLSQKVKENFWPPCESILGVWFIPLSRCVGYNISFYIDKSKRKSADYAKTKPLRCVHCWVVGWKVADSGRYSDTPKSMRWHVVGSKTRFNHTGDSLTTIWVWAVFFSLLLLWWWWLLLLLLRAVRQRLTGTVWWWFPQRQHWWQNTIHFFLVSFCSFFSSFE